MTEEEYVVKVEYGNVRLFTRDDAFKRHFCGNAASAELKGDEIHVTFKNGVRRIYNVNGSILKTS